MGHGTGERRRRTRDRPLWLFPCTPSLTVFSLDICLAFKRLCFLLSRTINENPRRVLQEMLAGGLPPGSQNPDLISHTKKCGFRTRFQTWPLKSIPVFRPEGDHKTQHKHWNETEIMSSLLRLKLQQKHFLKSIPDSHITLSFLFIWNSEATNTLTHHRSSFVNHARFQTKMSKVYTLFQTKTEKKPYPMGRHMPTWLL